MLRLAPALLLVLALAAGCRHSPPALAEGAAVAPASAALYLSVDSRVESEQWRRLDEFVSRFPGRRGVLQRLGAKLGQHGVDLARDVRPAVGPTLELVWLDLAAGGADVVALTRPTDEEKLRELLAKGDEPAVVTEIDGWLAVARSERVLARFRSARARGSLADDERFREAMDELPDDAIAHAYASGAGLTNVLARLGPLAPPAGAGGARLVAASAALEATEEGIRIRAWQRSEGDGAEAPKRGDLLERVPAGALAFVRFASGRDLEERLRARPELAPVLAELERELGLRPPDLASLLTGEGVLYVRPAVLVPEVTLLLEPDDAAAAHARLDAALRRLAERDEARLRTTTVDGVRAMQLALGPVSVLAAALDGRVVVTTARRAIRALRGDGDRLLDDEDFRAAHDAAGVEDGEDVVLFADVEELLALAEQLALARGEPLPQDARASLEPLGSVVAAVEGEGRESSFRLLVGMR